MKYYKYDYEIVNQESFLINTFLNEYHSQISMFLLCLTISINFYINFFHQSNYIEYIILMIL